MTTPSILQEPLQDFSQCHVGIVSKLQQLGELPPLIDAAQKARESAEAAVAFFHDAIFEHHQSEEKELFPAVLSSAMPGEEADKVRAMVERLTLEHRLLESTWKKIEGSLRKVAAGKVVTMNYGDIEFMVRKYLEHADFEEKEFLPLSHTILGRNSAEMAALGLALHMRHAPRKILGYI